MHKITRHKKNLAGLFVLFCLLVTACGKDNAESETDITKFSQEEIETLRDQKGFYVEGTTLYDANGNPFVMRGVNHAHTWYSDKLLETLDALETIGCNSVRIVLSNGEQWSKTEASSLEGIIAFCKERNLIAVLEVHDPTGSSEHSSLLAAAQYFVDMKDVLIGEEEYVIINIANEWPANRNAKTWKEGYLEAIPMLREAGLAHTIMVDSAGWGQYGKCIKEAGAEVFAADPLGNVMFSVHMYGSAGGSAKDIEKNLRYATDQGLCVCVGEFGYTHSDGDVDEAFLMQYCEGNNIGYLAWSWKGNSGGVEYLDLAAEWDGSVLSADWGEVVVNGPEGIRETAKLCTVFTEKVQDNTSVTLEELKEQTGFYVSGTTLCDANGNPFVMRGVNHMHTWFTDKMEVTAAALEENGCNCVRIVLSNGEQWDENEAAEVERIIEICKEHNLIAVLEVHDTTGKWLEDDLLAAVQYFVDIKDVLIGEEDYVIINIANEWPSNNESNVWKEAYEEAIPMLREAGLAHTIMIDCAGGGQYGKCMEAAGAEVLASDPLGNVMFSVHMYGTAGGSAEIIEQNLLYAIEKELCVCVGEFGFTHGDGDVDEAFLMQYCEENDIGYLAWSWKGNASEASYLDMATEWDGSVLSADWGEVVVNGPCGIGETAEMCSVFEQ
mgnify:CR=1 FL=1